VFTSDNSLRGYGGDDETRTRDLCRDSARGDCLTQRKSYKATKLWLELWVETQRPRRLPSPGGGQHWVALCSKELHDEPAIS